MGIKSFRALLSLQYIYLAVAVTRQELLQKSSTLLGRFAYEVRVSNALGLFDINTIAEDLLVPIFATIFSCPKLQNQNKIQMNFPAVDLGCRVSRLSIQVTSDASSGKVIETLKKFQSHGLGSEFDRVLVYVLTERQRDYSSAALAQVIAGMPIEFSTSRDILDFHGLTKLIGELPNEKIQEIVAIIGAEFEKTDSNARFRSELDEFLKVSVQKIEEEKRTKKYIPSVFAETSEIKEEMRFFANPMFFYEKIDEKLNRFSLDEFNGILRLARVDEFDADLRPLAKLPSPSSFHDLQIRLAAQLREVSKLKDQIAVFSYFGRRAERYVPKDYLDGYWEVFQHSVEHNGSGIYRYLDGVEKQINLTQAKIFLVTGMAGQGKTNFVCDLVENQFRKFEIPTIFIPARKLNDFPRPNRIVDYILNNRFKPDVTGVHELLALFNNVAKDFGRPFIVVLDGINEVGDLDGFTSELRVFLEAICQYDFIKVIITCRNEFFDHKFADLFDPQFTEYLHRVKDLRSEMSDGSKARLLSSYIEYFQIDARLSESAKNFLKNDLILLRIFCDIYEGKSIGYVPEIYRGDILEKYLIMKIGEFPAPLRRKALPSVYKICANMLNNKEFSSLLLEGFDSEEMIIIEKLVGEDIILRREVPASGLASMGVENISFTYDEMRDFLLAYYLVIEVAPKNPEKIKGYIHCARSWIVYEGLIRYIYVLARKHKCTIAIEACEVLGDFDQHYINNLHLLSADIQTPDDVARIRKMLSSVTVENELRNLAWILFMKQETSNHINITILLDHLNSMDDEALRDFVKIIFSRPGDYRRSEWMGRIGDLFKTLLKLDYEKQVRVGSPALAIGLFFIPFANWEEREAMKNLFTSRAEDQAFREAILSCDPARSSLVKACIGEIVK